MKGEVAIALGDNGRMSEVMALGEYTPFTCPECHGVLVKIKEGKMARFRCHTGHAFTLSHLFSEVTQYSEDALMNALRTLEETELLLDHAWKHLNENHQGAAATELSQKMEKLKRQAALVKAAAMENDVFSLDTLNVIDPGAGR
jgi:two-component system chemotaxis response regulator CheB